MMPKTPIEALCDHFDDELERQENVLALCIAQGEAARARDRHVLEAKTAALSLLIDDTVRAEAQRLGLVKQVVAEEGIRAEEATLSHLIALQPEPFKSRLRYFQDSMKSTVARTQEVVRENNHLIRSVLYGVNRTLRAFSAHAGLEAPTYTASGEQPAFAGNTSKHLNQQG